MTGHYQYPGDDPSALGELSISITGSQSFLTVLTSGLGETASQLGTAWTGDAADMAQADMKKITTALPAMNSKLKSAGTAVDTYKTAIVGIRKQVDELNTQYAGLAAQLSSEQDSYARAGRLMQANADPGESSADVAASTAEYRTSIAGQERKTQGQMAELDRQYKALVSRSNTAAETCSTALQSASTQYGYAGSTPTTQGLVAGLGLSDLGVEHAVEATAAGKQAAALAKEIADGDTSKIDQLNAITAKYYGDPTFSVTFYNTLGPEDANKLPVQLGIDGRGSSDPAIGALQRTLGADFAAATKYYGSQGDNHDHVPQLSDDFVHTVLADGSKSYKTGEMPVYGFQGLGVLLHTGQYNAKLLQDSGEAIRGFETSYAKDHHGSSPWYPWDTYGEANGSVMSPTGGQLWWGGTGGKLDDNGNDPFAGWSHAGLNNPPAERAALNADGDLTNYLLNDRDWSAYSGGSANGPYGTTTSYEDGQYKVGLGVFGASLDKAIGIGAHDQASRQLFTTVVHDLGDDKLNHRIDTDHFADGDWIPPELRPYLGDAAAKNIDVIHSAFTDQNTTAFGTNEDQGATLKDLSRFLADEGKDPAANTTIAHAENGYAQAVMAGKFGDGHLSTATDVHSLAAIHGLLDYGKDVHASAETQAADQAHNDTVDEISSYATFGLDQAAGEIPGAGEEVKFGMDKLIGIVTDSLHVDHSQLTNVQNANQDFDDKGDVANVIRQAQYDAIASKATPDHPVLATLGLSADEFPNGIPSDFSGLSSQQRQDLNTAVHDYNAAHGHDTYNDQLTSADTDFDAAYSGAANLVR